MPTLEDIVGCLGSGKELLVVSSVPIGEVHVVRKIECPWCHSAVTSKTTISKDKKCIDMIYHCTCCAVGKRGFRLVPAGEVYAIEQVEK